jgi:hypothetical protein
VSLYLLSLFSFLCFLFLFLFFSFLSSLDQQLAVFENLRRNYGNYHFIHYINLIVINEDNSYFMIDCPLKTVNSLASHRPQMVGDSFALFPTMPGEDKEDHSPAVDVTILPANAFPLLSHSRCNDTLAFHFSSSFSSRLTHYREKLLVKLFYYHLLQRFGKKEEFKKINSFSSLRPCF